MPAKESRRAERTARLTGPQDSVSRRLRQSRPRPLAGTGSDGVSGGLPSLFFQGDLGDLLVYDRALTAVEREQARAYLTRKYQGLPAPALAEPRVLAGGSFQFRLLGESGTRYEVQISANLPAWTPWTNLLCTNASMLVVDPDAPRSAPRYYRAVAAP